MVYLGMKGAAFSSKLVLFQAIGFRKKTQSINQPKLMAKYAFFIPPRMGELLPTNAKP
jgi:hypothetical protein